MPNFLDQIKILRRFLRDPDALIWTNEDLLFFWNDAQIEVAQKTGYVERARAIKFPPGYNWSYLYDWEKNHVEGESYQALSGWQSGDSICTYPWEAAYWLLTSTTPDDGYRFIYPWEGVQTNQPADSIKIPLDPAFKKSTFVAFNELKLEPTDKRELTKGDPFYISRTGEARSYYHPDAQSNQIVLYPRPSNVVWSDTHYIPLESTGQVQMLSELGEPLYNEDGTPLVMEGQETAGDGMDLFTEDTYDRADVGIITELTNITGQLFLIFEAFPWDVTEYETDLDYWPTYMLRVIRYATLENAFGANTDGFIPSLRDFWKSRKDLGIKAILATKAGRMKDRDYRMGGTDKPFRSRRLRLPAGYPAQYP